MSVRHRDQDPFDSFELAEKFLKRTKRRQNLLFLAVFLLALVGSSISGEVDLGELITGFPAFFNYFGETVPEIGAATFFADIGEWYWGMDRWLLHLWDTVLIAFLATLIGFTGAFIFCFPASKNLNSIYWLYFACRRLMEFGRSVPELVFALIFVFSYGLGPLPGVMAIAVHSFGALGKLFSEINENIDLRSREGVMAAGGNWFQTIRYAVVPQVLPNFMSYTLLRFEINVRAASVVGFVGAGGIGQELMIAIRQFIYEDVSAIVLMLLLTVVIIDVGCEKIRHRTIGHVRPV